MSTLRPARLPARELGRGPLLTAVALADDGLRTVALETSEPSVVEKTAQSIHRSLEYWPGTC